MDGGLRGKKNKNAVAQSSSNPKCHPENTRLSSRDLADGVDGQQQQSGYEHACRNAADRTDPAWNNHAADRNGSAWNNLQCLFGIDDPSWPRSGETANRNATLDNDVHHDDIDEDDNSRSHSGSSGRDWQDDDTFDHPQWQFLKDYTDSPLDMVTGADTTSFTNQEATPVVPADSQTSDGSGATTAGTDLDGGTSSQSIAPTEKSNVRTVTNRYMETNATLAQLVLPEGLILKDVFADGNCLFASVVDQLRVRGEFFYTTRSLREVAVNYLRENPCQEDGTPLHQFLTEHDGTWNQYLARMSREGEWGDHFVISALASVLKRRLVILRGFDELTRTVMEPGKPGRPRRPAPDKLGADKSDESCTPSSTVSADPEAGADHDDARVQCDGVQRAEAEREVEGEDEKQLGDLYIGHIAEAHYVSLRYIDWEDRLYRSLNDRTVPSFLKYSQDLEPGQQHGISERAGEGEETTPPAFPVIHLDFFLKYIASGEFILNLPFNALFPAKHEDQMSRTLFLGDPACGLESNLLLGRMQNRLRAKARAGADSSIAANDASFWDSLEQYLYVVPKDTKVRQPDSIRDSVPKKDLVAIETDCPVGFTRLLPLAPALWRKALERQDEIWFLRHLHLTSPNVPSMVRCCVAFASSWPHCSDFLTRPRSYGWPEEALLDSARKNGAHVIPMASSHYVENLHIEWHFSFRNTEKLLCLWMPPAMRNCYLYLRGVCQVLFQDEQFRFPYKDAVCKPEIKAVFFYTCEQVPTVWFQERPGHCLLLMLKKLQGHLETGFLPDYFIPEANLIGGVQDYILHWHAEQLAWFQEHVLESMFLMFDKEDVMNIFSLGRCFEMLVSDAQRFVVHGSVELSYYDCFLPLSILAIQNWVLLQRFDSAKQLCDTAIEECATYMQSVDASQEILPKVLAGLPLLEKWLFSFYMDLMIGSNLLQLACRGHACAKLDTMFGEACVTILAADLPTLAEASVGSSPASVVSLGHKLAQNTLQVPLTVVYSESIVTFAERLTLILYDQEDLSAFKAATHFFLKNKIQELLLNIASEERQGNYHTGHNDTKIRLKSMFDRLYHVYNEEKQMGVFYDLMEPYDLLSRHYRHVQLNRHVSLMWKFYRQPNKQAAATARLQSLLNMN